MGIVIAGTIAFDQIARVDELPHHNESALVTDLSDQPGGCAGNVATALARLGHRPRVLSAVGHDFAGSAYEKALATAGVDLGGLVRDADRLTARAFLAGDAAGHQLIFYHEGATVSMDRCEPVAAPIGHFAPGELSAYPRLMAACDVVVFDPGQEVFHRGAEVVMTCLEHVDILFANEHEAQRIADHVGSMEALFEHVPTVIVTDREGQTIHQEGRPEPVRVAAAPVDAVVDPTGAGDGHRAGFVHGLVQGWDVAHCCRFGSVVAACAIEQAGAQAGLPSLAEAEARYTRVYPDG